MIETTFDEAFGGVVSVVSVEGGTRQLVVRGSFGCGVGAISRGLFD